jgi:hypothetical protein
MGVIQDMRLHNTYKGREASSKVKGILRKVQARTRESLVEATGWALDAITRKDIRSFYADCGYHLPLQSL